MDLLKKLYLFFIKIKPPCIFKLVTGFDCPGCGGSHALWAALNGHFIKSFLYHPAVMTSALLAVYCVITSLIKKKSTLKVGHIYAVLIITLIHWIIKAIFHIAGSDYTALIDAL